MVCSVSSGCGGACSLMLLVDGFVINLLVFVSDAGSNGDSRGLAPVEAIVFDGSRGGASSVDACR